MYVHITELMFNTQDSE